VAVLQHACRKPIAMAVPMHERPTTENANDRSAVGQPLNILVVHEMLPHPDRHGTDVQWMQMLRELRAQGHKVIHIARSGVNRERLDAGRNMAAHAATHADAPVFSVIIPTYNREAVLKECLDALARQTVRPEMLEAIVVDDGSTDGTEQFFRNFRPNYSFHYLRQLNAGAARRAACARRIFAAFQ
jgi:hypothetical protein